MTEHDQGERPVQFVYPAYELRWEDFVGIGLHVVGQVAGAVAQGFVVAGNDFLAAARFKRAWTREVARREELERRFGDITSQIEMPEDLEDES